MTTLDKVRQAISAATAIPESELSPKSTLEDLNIDSMSLIEVSIMLKDRTGVRFTAAEINAMLDVAELVSNVESRSSSQS